jgi:mono/diheme cytochrome c family protein
MNRHKILNDLSEKGYPLWLTIGLPWLFVMLLANSNPATGRFKISESAGLPTAAAGKRERDDGRKIFLDQCARCHGAEGEGSEEYPSPLVSDLPLEDLTKYIHAAMPEDDPKQCVDEEAALVAQYVRQHILKSSHRPAQESAKISFSRLTNRQLKESLADLAGSFDHPPGNSPERGLKAFYFASRHWNEKRKLAEQIDRSIDFAVQVPHFDPTDKYEPLGPKPEAENKMGDGFSVHWSGSVLAPQTGWYDIRVESKNGFQLYLNDQQQPLIDRKVRSDDVVDHSARVYFLAGRAYRLKLDFFSYPDPPARIRLLWKPPQGVEEVIPNRYLTPHSAAESLAVSTSFPPDDASTGYERGISISGEWDESVTQAALEAADWIGNRLWHFAKTDDLAEDRLEKVKSFCLQFVELAFAKSLSDEEQHFFVEQHFNNGLPLKDQVKRVVILTLKSPSFLYPELDKSNVQSLFARRLALTIWDSVPDRELFRLAQENKLSDPQVFEQQVHRMLADARADSKLRSFFHDWLNIEKKMNVSKDETQFAGFDEHLVYDCRQSLELFLDHLIKSDHADARQLFISEQLMVNRRMADFYGIEWPQPEQNEEPGNESESITLNENLKVGDEAKSKEANPSDDRSEFVLVAPPYAVHSGIITHPFLMSGLAYYQHSSPIHRGVFVARKLLGRPLKQPNENFEPLAEDFDPSMNTRERVEFQTKDTTCMSCHSIINPLGFTFENFDAVGRYRTTEKEKPIDVTTHYKLSSGDGVTFHSPRELADFLAQDKLAQQNFVRQFFQHYTRQPIEAYGNGALEAVHQEFVEREFNLRELVTAAAKISVAPLLNNTNTTETDSLER